MAGLNKVMLIGNLGRDPELRKTPSGTSVASFTLATTERWTDKSGERQPHTEWHNIVAWGKLGELAHQYLKKGRSAYVEGRITTRSWDDKDGNKRYKTEIVANTIQFLGSPGDSSSSGDNAFSKVAGDASEGAFTAENTPSGAEPVVEDDLPF